MKKLRFLKRVVAMLLVLIMGTSGALQTVSVYAAETVNTQVEDVNDSGDSQEGDVAGDVAVDGNMPSGSTSEDGVSLDDNMTVTGTNSFGNLLSDALSTETEEQAQNNGYNVFSIEMSGNTATVDMEALGECTLIVALYDNDGKVMLTSNATEVTKDTREATVQLEATKIPQYYYLRAFLVDTITYQPMCTMYESNLYTEAMQAFLAKTTDDFDQDKVLNLDDDKINNFAVFSDTTKLIPTVDGVNTVASVDDATGTYTFENVDSNITSLVAGDIFAYEYNGELYIVKVASISVSGTTATIVEGETSMEEVFEYVK
ncbi:MAG: fibronectin, partial [Lachnospira sp.]|nr:fibronectin [Lachnospira sp.]